MSLKHLLELLTQPQRHLVAAQPQHSHSTATAPQEHLTQRPASLSTILCSCYLATTAQQAAIPSIAVLQASIACF
jgi:hypothetical protein